MKNLIKDSIKSVIFVFVVLTFQTNVWGQIQFTIEPSELNLTVNSKVKTVEIKAVGTDPFPENSVVTWSGGEGYVEITQTLAADRRSITSTFKPIKSTPSLTLTGTIGSESQTLKLVVLPEVTLNTLNISPTITSADNSNGIQIIQGGKKAYSLTPKDPSLSIPPTALSPKSDDESIAKVSVVNNSQFIIEGKNPGTTIVHLLGWGENILNLPVTVTKGVNFEDLPNSITIKKGDSPVDLSEKFPAETIGKLNVGKPKDRNIADISNDNKLTGIKVDRTSFEVSLKENNELKKTIDIIVTANPAKITFSGFEGSNNLIIGQSKTISAEVVSDDGKPIQDAAITLKTSNDCISIKDLSDNRFSVTAEENCASPKLTAEATVSGEKITGEIEVQVKTIIGFSPLQIRLDLLDDRNAKDLFGTVTAKEFFVAKVRLFNLIPEDVDQKDSPYINYPILVYSESLEVKVAVQIKCEKKQPNCTEQDWTDKTETELATLIFNNGADPATAFARYSINKGQCKEFPAKNFFFPYRPYVFEMITNTQDNRADRSVRSRIMTAVNGASSLASFVTSIAVPGSSSDLPLGLDKFKNLLIPSIERLYPSMREVHRQNLIRWAMRPLEEIPFGSDITRVVFFPKGAISGMIPGYQVRITGVSITNACAEVAFIDKLRNL